VDRSGRITTAGSITSYPVAKASTGSINGIVTGPDQALWFTERIGNSIGRLAP